MPVVLGIFYIISQILGAYVGALLVNFYTLNLPILTYNDKFFMRALVNELLGSFMYVVFVLIQIDEKLGLTKDATLHCFGIASAYVAARAIFYGQMPNGKVAGVGIGTYGAVLNPAIALGIQLSTLFNDGFGAWKAIYIYPTVPLGASVLGTLFFDRIYVRIQDFLNPTQFGETKSPQNSNVRDFSNPQYFAPVIATSDL